MPAVEVRVGPIKGALTTVAGVLGGAVVAVEVVLSAGGVVVEKEDILGAKLVITGVVEAFAAVAVGVNLI